MALADAAPFAVAAYALDEASGTRFDQVSSNDLTDNNTVASAAGVFGNAADFESGNSEYLDVADNSDISLGGGVNAMVRAWVKLESKAANMAITSQWDSGSSDRGWVLYYDSGVDRFRFVTGDGADSVNAVVTADNLGSPSIGTWYLLHAWQNASGNQIGIAVNAGTADTASTGGLNIENSQSVTTSFKIGRYDAANYFDGLIDDVVLLKNYILDATERSEDYNGGTGVAFADWAGGGGGGTNRRRRLICARAAA